MFQSSVSINIENGYFFYQALSIYLRKQQVINRKLSCSTNVLFAKLKSKSGDIFGIIEILKKLQCFDSKSLGEVAEYFEEIDLQQLSKLNNVDGFIYISIDRLTPKNVTKFQPCLVATIIDTSQTSATFYQLQEPPNILVPTVVYELSFSSVEKLLKLSVVDREHADEEPCAWLQFVLHKKFQSWMENCTGSVDRIESHRLINPESYNDIYSRLKQKYGKSLEASWNESTDPKKFIYEDIAIASYLITYWNEEREKHNSNELQSFVDLGCGNGLLVYLLSQEGHRGYGIDLRKRKIWDQFSPSTDLREVTIIPSDQNLFSDVDWIIGNHSDELSPWISVISARSSFYSRFFLLPCCAFEFSGKKFQRKGSFSKSLYLTFIDYLLEISEVCGFKKTEIDRLKIPSTKRICIVGTGRNFEMSEFNANCNKIQNFIDSSNDASNNGWSSDFNPRAKIEAVRNCTKIDRNLKDSIVKIIFDHLLATEELDEPYRGWNKGGVISLSEAVKLISSNDLKKLKSECGGLQTLLRNRPQIFSVHNGQINIKVPLKLCDKKISEKSLRKNVIRSSPCYFFNNHPHSCPLTYDDCSYKH